MSITISHDLRPGLGPVKDQGKRCTCLAHATSSAHEEKRNSTTALSVEYLHFFATTGEPAKGSNWTAMSEALRGHGQPTEIDCPYQATPPVSGWSPPSVPVFRRLSDVRKTNSKEIEDIIKSTAVAIIGIKLPQSFFRPKAPWIIEDSGPVRGRHAVLGVGLGSHQGNPLILIRNSWGGKWADQGHAWLDVAFLRRHLVGVRVLTHEVVA